MELVLALQYLEDEIGEAPGDACTSSVSCTSTASCASHRSKT
ncbi:hypothetical protein [Stigmatella hybrida]|nr:hypothetical protein [Stigmatella hybrida]